MSKTGVLKRIRLGDDISASCGKCKEERLHQVVAMKTDGSAERVVCRTCQSNHLYREKKATPSAKRVGGNSRQREAGGKEISGVRALRPYSSSDVYRLDEWISHPKFGQGRVIEVRNGKVTVRFGFDTRTLLHAG